MDIPSALLKDEEHPGFYSASYPGASNMMGIIPHECPTHANRSKTSSRSRSEQPAPSPVEENFSTSLTSPGKSDDSASTIAPAPTPSNLGPPSIADFLATSQDLNSQSEDDPLFDATFYAEQDSLSETTPRAEQNNPVDETPRAEKDDPFESNSDDEMNRRRFSLPLGFGFKNESKNEGADDTSKKARRFSIFNTGFSPRAERAIGQSIPLQSIKTPGELESEYTLNRSVNKPLPRVRDFGDHDDTAPYPVVPLSPGCRTISRQSAAIYGIPPASTNLRTVHYGSSTKQDSHSRAISSDHDPTVSFHSATTGVTKKDQPAANKTQGFQRPDDWFHQGLVDDDTYCTQQEAFEDDALDTCSTHNDVLHSSSPKSSYTLKRPQQISTKQSRQPKEPEQILKSNNREPDSSTTQAANAIANIDLEYLARPDLSAKQKDTYLDAAIATAKRITKTTGLPLMILKDHKSDVVVPKKGQAMWLAGASEWKARVLAEAETAKDKHAITELQQLGMTQTRALSLPTITTTAPPGAGISPSTLSPNQRPQTLSKAHEILGLTTPPRVAPLASPKGVSPRASPRYQHKPFRSSRSLDIAKLRKKAWNASPRASPTKKTERSKEGDGLAWARMPQTRGDGSYPPLSVYTPEELEEFRQIAIRVIGRDTYDP